VRDGRRGVENTFDLTFLGNPTLRAYPLSGKRDARETQRDKILFGLTAPDEVVIKSWKPRITSPFFWKLVVIVSNGRDGRNSVSTGFLLATEVVSCD